MTQKKRLIIILTLILFMIGIFLYFFFLPSDIPQDIMKETGIDFKRFKILSYEDSHGGFLGDGERIIVMDCNGMEDKIEDKVKNFSPLPLPSKLKDFLGNSVPSADKLKDALKSENGYFYFKDRGENKSEYNDSILERPSLNFTIIIYNDDINYLYYYELDT